MKNKIIRIIEIAIILIIIMAINSNATSFNLSTDEKQIKSEDEIILKVQAEDNIETATFYLKYDYIKLEFIENLTEKAIVKDYPEDGILRVVYLDPVLEGEKEICFKFKAKTNSKDETTISVTNLTVQFVNDSNVYTKDNLNTSIFETSINIKGKNVFVKVGIIAIIVLLIIINIINKKVNKQKIKEKL